MKYVFRSIVLVVMVMLTVFQSLNTQAFSNFYSDSEIQFIDPNACDPRQEAEISATPSNQATSPGSIYIMGDSITAIAKKAYQAKFKSPWKPTVEGLSSRHINKEPPKPDGIAQIEKDGTAVEDAKVIVVALGTNDSGSSEASNKKAVEDTIEALQKQNDSAPIFWVNIIDSRSDKNSKKTNRAIKEGLASDGSVIDWYSAAKEKASLDSFSGGVHPTKQKDIDLLVDLVFSKVSTASTENEAPPPVSSCCPTPETTQEIGPLEERVDGSSPAQKVFNYLKIKGATDAGAAGVVGNLMVESGGNTYNLNPKADNGSHRGIAQWDKANRWKKLVEYTNSLPGNRSPDDIAVQWAYLWKEMEDGYGSLLATIKTTSDAKKAATQFDTDFERSGGSALAKRITNANKALKDFAGGDGSSSQQPSSAAICVCEDPNASGAVGGGNVESLKAFIKKYADSALAAGKAEGVPYDAMLAQIALESGIPLSELASKYNNFGGIKFTGKGKSTPPLSTTEAGQGAIMARFRAFDTAEEGIRQQAKFFTENSRYSKALAYPRNPVRFIQEVAKAGYATDPLYAQKVIGKLKQVQQVLRSLDKPLSKDVTPTKVAGSSDQSDESSQQTVFGCAGSAAAGEVVDGFAFPVGKLKRDEVGANSAFPCVNRSGCHHDGTHAFDLGKAGGGGVLGDKSKGLPVYAIEDGVISQYRAQYKGIAQCPSYQLKGKSGWVYWYGHTQTQKLKQGTKVKAGEEIAVVGPSKCTGNGSAPHLHIDRGAPKGRTGGSKAHRDPSITPLMNKLWEALP